MPFIKGQSYDWNEILEGSESVAGPVFYLLHRIGTQVVTAACINIKWNPRAPYEIWPGIGPEVRRWADVLDQQTGDFNVFVRETDDRHYYRGKFRRVSSSTDSNEIALRKAQAEREAIYKIIFLAEVPSQP